MEASLRIEVVFEDHYVLQVRVSASNRTFAGQADVYLGVGELGSAAAELEAFPRAPGDSREVVLGQESAEGRAALWFHCVDASGHAQVQVKIWSGRPEGKTVESVTLLLPIEAAAIDDFRDALRTLRASRVVSLRGAV